jgi:hypothetical protein
MMVALFRDCVYTLHKLHSAPRPFVYGDYELVIARLEHRQSSLGSNNTQYSFIRCGRRIFLLPQSPEQPPRAMHVYLPIDYELAYGTICFELSFAYCIL